MFAVVRTGGKQYRVEQGSILEIEKLPGDVGQTVSLDDVLLVADGSNTSIGKPTVKGASVQAQIIEQKKAPKVIIFKKIRRHGYHKKQGHRQQLTRVKVTEIHAG